MTSSTTYNYIIITTICNGYLHTYLMTMVIYGYMQIIIIGQHLLLVSARHVFYSLYMYLFMGGYD